MFISKNAEAIRALPEPPLQRWPIRQTVQVPPRRALSYDGIHMLVLNDEAPTHSPRVVPVACLPRGHNNRHVAVFPKSEGEEVVFAMYDKPLAGGVPFDAHALVKLIAEGLKRGVSEWPL